jgi:hypothetical protein
MQRPCDVCGETYEAKRPTSKYCSTRCRTRASRGTPTEHAGTVPVTPLPVPEAEIGPIESATLDELTAVGREGSALGCTALALARKLDAGRETGAAMASLAKQLEATKNSATEGLSAAADPLDELRARRDAKRNAG